MEMIVMFLLTFVIVWLFGTFIFPFTFTADWINSNAKNGPGYILIKPGVNAAIWAQELYEARRAWMYLPMHVPLILIGRLIPDLAFYERSHEIMGQEVEVQAESLLFRADLKVIRRREAQDLASYRAFIGWDVDQIEEKMIEKSTAAFKFVTDNRYVILERHRVK